MAEEYWNVFKENGDVMCYLLYKAKERRSQERTQTVDAADPEEHPAG